MDIKIPMDPSAGVFFTPALYSYKHEIVDSYCVPFNIRIYSNEKPIRFRYVNYQINFLPNDKSENLSIERLLGCENVYRCPHTGLTSLTFKIKAKSISLDDLLIEIRRHFLNYLRGDVESITRKECFRRITAFIRKNKNISSSDFHHLTYITHDDSGVFVSKEMVRYKKHLDESFTQIPFEYNPSFMHADFVEKS